MRINRTTAMALAASATLVVGSGVVASAAVLDLPVFGFGGHEATGTAASPATTTPPPSVVEQTVYDDHYVTTPGPSGAHVEDEAWGSTRGTERGRRPERSEPTSCGRAGATDHRATAARAVDGPHDPADDRGACRSAPAARGVPGTRVGSGAPPSGSAPEATDGEAPAGRARWAAVLATGLGVSATLGIMAALASQPDPWAQGAGTAGAGDAAANVAGSGRLAASPSTTVAPPTTVVTHVVERTIVLPPGASAPSSASGGRVAASGGAGPAAVQEGGAPSGGAPPAAGPAPAPAAAPAPVPRRRRPRPPRRHPRRRPPAADRSAD